MIDFQIVGMPIAEKNRERLAREKTIKAKKRGTAKEQDKPNKHKKGRAKGKQGGNQGKQGKKDKKPYYKAKAVKNKARRKKK